MLRQKNRTGAGTGALLAVGVCACSAGNAHSTAQIGAGGATVAGANTGGSTMAGMPPQQAAGGQGVIFVDGSGGAPPPTPAVDSGAQVRIPSSHGDISHPAFYVRGQELESGNTRAFAALEPCRADGSPCETGVDCCGRLCTNGKCGAPPVKTCSRIDEGCKTVADCCPGSRTLACIAGFCAEGTIR